LPPSEVSFSLVKRDGDGETQSISAGWEGVILVLLVESEAVVQGSDRRRGRWRGVWRG